MSLLKAKDKWTKRNAPQVLRGRLVSVEVNSGFFDDKDTMMHIVPVAADRGLLVNHLGVPNEGRAGEPATIECEIRVTAAPLAVGDHLVAARSEYSRWVRSLLNTPVTVTGVYVDDDGHGSRTEIHPVDLIAARVSSPASPDPNWWVHRRATQRNLVLDQSLFAYRFAAAADTRKGTILAGPPLSGVTRTASLLLDLPPQPGPTWTPSVANTIASTNPAATLTVSVSGTGANRRLQVDATCKSVPEGGPGVVLGEAIAFWKDPSVPELSLDPRTMNFGQVVPMDSTRKSVRIRNTSVAPLVVNVTGSGVSSVFSWPALNNVTISSGGFRDVQVTFRPRHSGPATATWHVTTNGALGPTTVALSGTGRDVIPP